MPPAIGRVAGALAIHHVRCDGQHGLGVDGVTIGRKLSELIHECGDHPGREMVDLIVVIAELRECALRLEIRD